LSSHKSLEIIHWGVFVEEDRRYKTTFNSGRLVQSTISLFIVEGLRSRNNPEIR
jgi:hypothetical protein